ncbi:hypothetical protein 20Oct199_00006 [Pseudomonas phage 20Oct199]|nr:hypothetical protein 20Oct199_00006 [Pseudomonas phage 20Oct199]
MCLKGFAFQWSYSAFIQNGSKAISSTISASTGRNSRSNHLLPARG